MLANPLPKPPEQKRNRAAQQTNPRQHRARPLVPQPMVHLRGEQHDARAPQRSDERLGRERRGRAVLVGVDEVVVGAVVDEDEAEADGEAGERGPDPGEAGEGGPREHDEADGDEPAGEHHGDQAQLGGGELACVGLDDFYVVLVDEGGAQGGGYDADGEGDAILCISGALWQSISAGRE